MRGRRLLFVIYRHITTASATRHGGQSFLLLLTIIKIEYFEIAT